MKRLIASLAVTSLALPLFAQTPANEMRIARGSDEYPPYEMRLDGKLTGLHVEVVQAVAAKIGLTVKWEELPWVRAQKCVEDKECDAITYISPTAEREKWASFLPGNVLSKVEKRFMIHKSNSDKLVYKGNAQEFLADKTVVVVAGYNHGPDIAKAKKYEVKNLPTLVSMIVEKRNDVAVISNDDFFGLKGRAGVDQLMTLNPPVWESKAYIAFSRAPASTAMANKFQAAYIEFRKSRDYQVLLTRFKVSP